MIAAAATNPPMIFAGFFTVSPVLILFDHPIGGAGLSIEHRACRSAQTIAKAGTHNPWRRLMQSSDGLSEASPPSRIIIAGRVTVGTAQTRLCPSCGTPGVRRDDSLK